jgi:hypothetical protein
MLIDDRLVCTGIRFTSCKSGKDRTGMSVTLEQVNLLTTVFDLARTERHQSLQAMRRSGSLVQSVDVIRRNIDHVFEPFAEGNNSFGKSRYQPIFRGILLLFRQLSLPRLLMYQLC